MAWGSDGAGQLGDGGDRLDRYEPTFTSGLGVDGDTAAVSAGAFHSLAVRTDGSVFAWGYDGSGQLGDGGTDTDQLAPVRVVGLDAASGGAAVVAVAAGAHHSLGLRSDGTVHAWGDDGFGQLGDGPTLADRDTPVPVSGLGPGSGVVAIAAGVFHSLALRADGSVLSWGSDGVEVAGYNNLGSGQLGDDDALVDQPTPVGVSGLGPGSGVVAIAAGRAHNLAVRSDGSVLAWGDDQFGQLGDGGTDTDKPTPVAVTDLGPGSGVMAVSGGVGHSLALRADGSVLAWGRDDANQLGDGGSRANQPTPVAVSGLGPGSGVRSVSAGGFHSLALQADGSVVAWGDDSLGQLGDGEGRTATSVPVPVRGLGAGAGVGAVSAGGYYSLAIRAPVRSTYAPLSPMRIWDSRVGPGPMGRIGPGQSRDITVTGVGGVPATGVTAVVLNVTAVGATAATYITVWPADVARPDASNLNVPAGDTRPNLVTVKVGAGGKVSVYNDVGTVDLVADVAGWYGPDGGQRYTTLTPSRVHDSRVGPAPAGRLGPGQTRDVLVTAAGGVPPTGVTAVVLNVTAVNATSSTFVTAWPSGEERPNASNLNLPTGDTRANLVVVKVGADGRVSFSNDAGSIDLVVDVAGYFSRNGGAYNELSPARIWDSRVVAGSSARLGPNEIRDITVRGVGGVPATGLAPAAVVVNVTAVAPTAGTFITAWPTGEPRPEASNLNLPAGDTRANLVVVKVGPFGQVSFFNHGGEVNLVVDVVGWYDQDCC